LICHFDPEAAHLSLEWRHLLYPHAAFDSKGKQVSQLPFVPVEMSKIGGMSGSRFAWTDFWNPSSIIETWTGNPANSISRGLREIGTPGA
jgi:hypothetical protein